MDELLKALGLLATEFAKDRNAVFALVQQHAHGVYQMAFDAGHTSGLTKGRDEKKESDRQLEEAKQRISQLEKDVKNPPEVERIREEAKLEVQRVKDAHKAELERERKLREDAVVDASLAQVDAHLATLGLEPVFRKPLLQDMDLRRRFRVPRDGKVPEIMKSPDSELPYSPVEGKTAAQLLAQELFDAAPAEWKRQEGDRGSDIGGPGGRTSKDGAPKSDKAKRFAELKKKLEEERKQERAAGSDAVVELQNKLRGTPRVAAR